MELTRDHLALVIGRLKLDVMQAEAKAAALEMELEQAKSSCDCAESDDD